MKLDIVGFSDVGKSTLFSSLTKAGARAADYPFCAIGPNVDVAAMPDVRTKTLGKMHHSKKMTPIVIGFADIVGLVCGTSKGEGLGNQFLADIRKCDAVVHVAHCFEDESMIHVDGSVGPTRDIEITNLELISTDLEVLERRTARTQRSANNDKSLKKELGILKELKVLFKGDRLTSTPETGDADAAVFVASLCLLTTRPAIYVTSIKGDDLADDGASSPRITAVRAYTTAHQSKVFCASAQIEEEIAVLDESEKADCPKALGISVSGLDKLIAMSYELLGLISFLTTGEDGAHAWIIKKGSKAPQAAGKIHTGFERGFIRAEVISYDDFVRCDSLAAAREKGLMRLEGKDYAMWDGDVILFRFNV